MILKNQMPKGRAQAFKHGDAITAIKENLLRFVEPGRRGEFIAALERLMTRRDVTIELLVDFVKPFLRYGLAGEFEAFVKRIRE